jgi:hypothetical protein
VTIRRTLKSRHVALLLSAFVSGIIADFSRSRSLAEGSGMESSHALIRPCSIPDTIPPGRDFITCGCINGSIWEFCSGPCEDVQVLCEEFCGACGGGTVLFTACVLGGC